MRLVDIDKAREEYRNLIDLTMSDTTLLHTLYGVLDTAPTVEAIPKADYENRLKADMVAILEETQAQIDDLWEATWHSDYRGGFKDGCIESNNIIQQKINSLEEAKDGENND